MRAVRVNAEPLAWAFVVSWLLLLGIDPRSAAAQQAVDEQSSQLVFGDERYRTLETLLQEPREIFIAEGTELSEALEVFSTQSGIPIRAEWDGALADEQITQELVVQQVDAPRLPAAEALRLLLRPLRLVAVVRSSYLVVTTQIAVEEEEEFLEVRAYRCSDLASDDDACQRLINILLDSTSDTAWEIEEGFGGTITPFGGMLVIKQIQSTHAQIEHTLDMMRAASAATTKGLPTLVFSQNRDELLESRLRNPIELHIAEGTPLVEAIDALAEQLDVLIYPDWFGALADEQITRDKPVQLDCVDMPAAEAMKLLLDPLQLVAVPRGGCLLLTTRIALEEADDFLEVRVYRCDDLASDSESQDQLIEVIWKTVANAAWEDEEGFGGTIRSFRDLLVIKQTPVVHAQIETTLNLLRRADEAIQSQDAVGVD